MRHVEEEPSVAFFDFDGTISTRDTLPLFLRFACGTGRCAAAALRVSPMLLGHLVGVVDNGKAKERLIGSLLAGQNRGDILAAGESFCSSVLPAFIRARAVERIRQHQRFGHRVVVLSASLEEWLAPWCRSLQIEICGTRLEYDAKGMATGRFATPNCHGKEKVRRAENLLGSDPRPATYAYGDSRGDKELLVWADQSWYRPFRGTRHPIVPENDMLQP
jgi:phosphatidylglycerophosphatase C